MNRRRITAYAAAFVATLGFDGAFHAVRAACVGSVAVTSCTATCSANCFLQNDINCVSGQGINLASGANLDMCGRSIHCTSQFGCGSKPAVGMLASGSQVTNGLAGVQGTSPSKIDGGWEPAVNCAGYTSTKVTKIWVEGALTYGVQNCATVERNVFINNGIAAVVTSGVANSSPLGGARRAMSCVQPRPRQRTSEPAM